MMLLVDSVFILKAKNFFMLDIGRIIYKKDMVAKLGLIRQNIWVNINQGKNMVQEYMIGQMGRNMKDIGI